MFQFQDHHLWTVSTLSLISSRPTLNLIGRKNWWISFDVGAVFNLNHLSFSVQLGHQRHPRCISRGEEGVVRSAPRHRTLHVRGDLPEDVRGKRLVLPLFVFWVNPTPPGDPHWTGRLPVWSLALTVAYSLNISCNVPAHFRKCSGTLQGKNAEGLIKNMSYLLFFIRVNPSTWWTPLSLP